jgi:hypothetical protein
MNAQMSRSLARILVTRNARIVTCRDGRAHGGRFRFNQCHFDIERNGGGGTLAVPVNNYFQFVCLGIAAGKIKWAMRHETGQPHPAR